MVDSVSVRFKNARVEKVLLNICIQWNAVTACVLECVLKTLACRGLRVGPSKFFRSGKTDPVQFKGHFRQGPSCFSKWSLCKQMSPLRARIFRSLEKGKFVFQKSLSKTPLKPYLIETGPGQFFFKLLEIT